MITHVQHVGATFVAGAMLRAGFAGKHSARSRRAWFYSFLGPPYVHVQCERHYLGQKIADKDWTEIPVKGAEFEDKAQKLKITKHYFQLKSP